MPTLRPTLMDGKGPTIWVSTVACRLLPTLPFGRQAMTTLYLPVDPRVNVLWSFGGLERLACLRPSLAVAAVCTFGSAHHLDPQRFLPHKLWCYSPGASWSHSR